MNELLEESFNEFPVDFLHKYLKAGIEKSHADMIGIIPSRENL